MSNRSHVVFHVVLQNLKMISLLSRRMKGGQIDEYLTQRPRVLKLYYFLHFILKLFRFMDLMKPTSVSKT